MVFFNSQRQNQSIEWQAAKTDSSILSREQGELKMAGLPKLDLSTEDLVARIARGHLQGKGHGVQEVWLTIAREELTDASTLAWAKLVAEWIVGPQEGVARQQGGLKATDKPFAPLDRTGRVHAALAISGWAEPDLDTLDDDHLLLKCAMEGLRPAAALVWHLIATGKATQGMRERWLDHVASRVVNADKTPPTNKAARPNAFMGAVGMSGKTKMTKSAEHAAILIRIIAEFPRRMYAADDPAFIREVLKRMQRIGIFAEDLSEVALQNWARFIRDELSKRESPAPQSDGE